MLAAVATAASFHRKAPRALGGRKRDLRVSRDKFATRPIPTAAGLTLSTKVMGLADMRPADQSQHL
jgi:hypothetical protein